MRFKEIVENNHGFIYLTTNLVNGKVYIGQRTFREGFMTYLGSGTSFRRAVKKYGKENFKRVILCVCKNYDELDQWEDFFVELFESRNTEKGYNIKKGGQRFSPKVIQSMSDSKIGRKLKPETIEKLKAARRGRKMSDYNKEVFAEINKGNKHGIIGIKLTSVETKEELFFESYIAACKFLNVANGHFRRYLEGFKKDGDRIITNNYETHILRGYFIERTGKKREGVYAQK